MLDRRASFKKRDIIDPDIVCIQILKVTAKMLKEGHRYFPSKVLESPLFYAFCESNGADPYLAASGIIERSKNGERILGLEETLERMT